MHAFPSLKSLVFSGTMNKKKNRKEVLHLLLKRGGIEAYDGKVGAQIVQAMKDEEISDELEQMFKSLTKKNNETPSTSPS